MDLISGPDVDAEDGADAGLAGQIGALGAWPSLNGNVSITNTNRLTAPAPGHHGHQCPGAIPVQVL